MNNEFLPSALDVGNFYKLANIDNVEHLLGQIAPTTQDLVNKEHKLLGIVPKKSGNTVTKYILFFETQIPGNPNFPVTVKPSQTFIMTKAAGITSSNALGAGAGAGQGGRRRKAVSKRNRKGRKRKTMNKRR